LHRDVVVYAAPTVTQARLATLLRDAADELEQAARSG
jgi:hypothetical protein